MIQRSTAIISAKHFTARVGRAAWVRTLSLAALWLVLSWCRPLAAQVSVEDATSPPYDPVSLIEDIFLGEGVDVVNVQYDGQASAVGYFKNESSVLGISEGIVISTGQIEGGGGVNALSSGNAQVDNGSTVVDNNLNQIVAGAPGLGSNVLNVSRYIIDFIPKGDRIQFKYSFASEEYPEYVCSDFNDVFGFFIEGPGFAGPYENGGENLAVVPGTSLPVAINTINPGMAGSESTSLTPCSAADESLAFSSLYVDNWSTPNYPVYDGLTTVLTAEAIVQPCGLYRIQITIGDIGDPSYDSGVFLEAKSFSTPALALDVETDALGGVIAESCEPGYVVFAVTEALSTPRTLNYTVGGTATPGSDYNVLPGTVVIPAGATEAKVAISALADGLAEPLESIEISVNISACESLTTVIQITDPVIPQQTFMLDTTVCSGSTVPLDATLPMTLTPGISGVNTEDEIIALPDFPITKDILISGVTPLELGAGHIARVCVDIEHDEVGSLDLILTAPSGKFIELSTQNGGVAAGGYRNVCFTTDATRRIDDPANTLPFSGDYLPEGEWSDLWRGGSSLANGTWSLSAKHNSFLFLGNYLSWSIEFNPPYDIQYQWSPTTGLSCSDCPNPTATVTGDISYTVTATDSYGCQEVAVADLALFGSPSAPVLTCAPGFDNLTWSWPLDPDAIRYEVRIDGGPVIDNGLLTSFSSTGLAFGQSVSIEVRAVGECDSQASTDNCTTQACPTLTVTPVVSNVTCAGYTDGAVALTTTGGASPYTYTLGASSNLTGNFGTLAAGNYTVTVADGNGCAGSASFTVLEPNAITASLAVTAPTSCGDPWVVIATAADGAGAPYGYRWSDSQTGATASFSASGTYTVDINDRNNCVITESVTITVADPLAASWSSTNVTCNGLNNGTATATATGGTAPLSYSTGGAFQPTPVFTGLVPGTYTVRVRDALGCEVTEPLAISEPAGLTIALTPQEVSCNGGKDGAVTTVVTGGTAPYTYAWDNGTPTADLSGLTAGTYLLTVTDANLCRTTESVIILEPLQLSVTLAGTEVSCFSGSDGSLQATVVGGVAPYTYRWTDGSTTTVDVLTGLPADAYGVTVTDDRGCTAGANATLTEPTALVASHTVQPVGCAGASTGSITLLPGGGTPPYTFAWVGGITTKDRSGLPAGTYDVVITDDQGCDFPYQVVLDEPDVLTLATDVTAVSCFGFDDGAIRSTPTGGVTPYTYEWRGPNGYAFFGPNPTQLFAGDYDLIFRDAFGCEIIRTVVVTQPIAIALNAAAGDSICLGASNGVAWVDVTGGTAPFTYLWDNGELTDTARALGAGPHTVRVTDANSCSFEVDVVVDELPEILLQLDQQAILCYGDSNGVAQVVGVTYGGVARDVLGLTYAWPFDPTVTGPLLSGLGGTQQVSVTATDARGCVATGEIEIEEPRELLATGQVISHVRCKDGSDGAAALLVEGGNGNYRFEWLTTTADPFVQNVADLPAGEFLAVAFDQNNCTDTASVILLEPDSLLVDVSAQAVNCFDRFSGAATSVVRGGTAPYSYLWADGETTPDLSAIDSGNYVLTVTDFNGCEIVDSALVQGFDFVTLTADVDGVTCNGDRDGSIVLEAAGGRGPHEFQIAGAPLNRFGEFRYLHPGEYWAVAVDRDGCPSDTMLLEVAEPQPILVEAGEEIELELGEEVTLDAQVFNAVGDVDYLWTPNDSLVFSCQDCPDPVFSPTFQGIVRINIMDERGCEAEDILRVTISKTLQVMVPTGFSPNSDGADDRLVVHGRSGTRIKSMQVFNRWGIQVHESGGFFVNNLNEGWDGRFGGDWAPAGTYLYRVEVEYLDGIVEVISGETTLVR